MAQAPRFVHLSFLFFQINSALDAGHDPSVSDAHDAFTDGRAMDFLDQYDEIDLSLFRQGSDGWDWDEMNAMFEQYAVGAPNDLSVQNNGLAYATAEVVERLQHGPWLADSGSEVDVTDLDIEQDW
jgi:hypothetical protein